MSTLPDLETYISASTLFTIRVFIGLILGLLTVFRRDLSCNREYHPDDDDDLSTRHESSPDIADQWEERDRSNEQKGNLRRRASSSSLPTLCNTPTRAAAAKQMRRDPTEEILESASLFLSGGPFLAVVLAVIDHLMLTVFLTSVASLGTLMWRQKTGVKEEIIDSSQTDPLHEETLHPQMNQSVHQVAFNAATEYFNEISSKLDNSNNVNTTPTQLPIKRTNRSKSVNNISQLSEEDYIDLITLARGHLDISLLPSETQIAIFSFLHPKDLLCYTCTHKKGARMLTDGSDVKMTADDQINTPPKDSSSTSERKTAMLIWKELFERDYAWILREWEIGREAVQRSLDVLAWDYFDETTLSAYQEDHRSTVLYHILSTTGIHHNLSHEVMLRHSLKSMKEFYFTFAETWLNYTIAGCNSTNKCLIGLHGHVFDISNFVEQHPGSTETLLLQAGRDATVFFETMGHSLGARRLALSMCVVTNVQCIDEDKGDCTLSNKKVSNNWGLLKPSSSLLHAKKSLPGFIIPRKRSKPRSSGALLRIRNALKREAIIELSKADRWGRTILGTGNLFGGVQVYFDPICCQWRWWYTDLNFEPVYTESAE
ncbi:hypothetical protein ACHAXN_001129 [Cyclotella atomus]